ncbi:putative transposable element [Trichonephila clavipes]|nr:putative transposable element [Trichonephila clavipes]
MTVVDASGRLPSGTLEGTLTDLGDYDQCLDVVQPKKSKHINIQGQYCTLEVQPVLPALANSVSMNTKVLNFGNISSDSVLSDLSDGSALFHLMVLRIGELWFQQDGATCHTARATIDLLKDTFGDRLISRFGPVKWPPRSCDLTPLDYFLWDYVKSLVYADKPQTLHHLEDNIHRVIADIRPQMLEKVIENWTSRLDYIRASRGSSMPEIIFKM